MNMDDGKLLELTRIMHELVLELGDLKERVAHLENRRTYALPPQPEVEVAESVKRQLVGENYENLGHLYMSGYHVCPISFGQVRDGDCLFCIAQMERP